VPHPIGSALPSSDRGPSRTKHQGSWVFPARQNEDRRMRWTFRPATQIASTSHIAHRSFHRPPGSPRSPPASRNVRPDAPLENGRRSPLLDPGARPGATSHRRVALGQKPTRTKKSLRLTPRCERITTADHPPMPAGPVRFLRRPSSNWAEGDHPTLCPPVAPVGTVPASPDGEQDRPWLGPIGGSLDSAEWRLPTPVPVVKSESRAPSPVRPTALNARDRGGSWPRGPART